MKQPRLGFALSLALLAGLLVPSSGLAALTLGQAPPSGGAAQACAANTSYVQNFSPTSIHYDTLAGAGIITKWKVQAGAAGGTMALQLLTRALVPPYNYSPVAESAVETLTPSTLNTFDTRIAITQDVYLGLRVVSGTPECFYTGFPVPGARDGSEAREASPSPAVGGAPTFYGNPHEGARLNVAAVVEPDSDGDGFIDETEDGCSDNPQRSDDCIKPYVSITKGPFDRTTKRRPTFAFESDEAGGTFECNLDMTKFKLCESPFKLKRLKLGKHNFVVRAVDANGNRSDPANFAYIVKKKRRG